MLSVVRVVSCWPLATDAPVTGGQSRLAAGHVVSGLISANCGGAVVSLLLLDGLSLDSPCLSLCLDCLLWGLRGLNIPGPGLAFPGLVGLLVLAGAGRASTLLVRGERGLVRVRLFIFTD